MLHLGTDTSLRAFDLIVYRVQTVTQVQFLRLPGPIAMS